VDTLSQIKKMIKIFFYFIKNIFKIYNDHYASYKWRDYSILGILKLENLKFISWLRAKYRYKKASNYIPFSPFCRADELYADQHNNKLPVKVRDIYKTGFIIVRNVLSESDISLINNFTKNQTLKSGNNLVQIEFPTYLNHIRSKLINNLEPIFFTFSLDHQKKKKFSKIYVGIIIDYSFSGMDASIKTANWHVDRIYRQ